MVEVTSSRLNWLSLLVRLNIGFTKVNIEHNWVKMNYQINLAWRMDGCIVDDWSNFWEYLRTGGPVN